jgi:hypothetical protein
MKFEILLRLNDATEVLAQVGPVKFPLCHKAQGELVCVDLILRQLWPTFLCRLHAWVYGEAKILQDQFEVILVTDYR